MKLVGYGVTRNGKPTGIWPITFQLASDRCRKLRAGSPGTPFEVVPIHTGEPVSSLAPLAPVDAKELA